MTPAGCFVLLYPPRINVRRKRAVRVFLAYFKPHDGKSRALKLLYVAIASFWAGRQKRYLDGDILPSAFTVRGRGVV